MVRAVKSEPVQVTLARLDERINALVIMSSTERDDRDKAIELAANELSRRLDVLNHAHEQALEDRQQYVTRTEIRWLIGTLIVVILAIVGYVAGTK